MKIFAYKILFLIFFTLPVFGELDEKTVTYSDFQYVRHVASSMTHVYFATSSGITRYNKMEQRWEEPLTSSDGIDHFDIHQIFVDEFDSKLFAVTSLNKYEYDLMLNNWDLVQDFPPIEMNYVHVQIPGAMHFPDGFNFSPDGFFIDPINRDFSISDIIDDRGGSSWFGTWGYGAGTAPSSSFMIEFLPYGLIQNRVDAIYNDDGLLYMSGQNYNSYRSGISIFDPDNNSFEHIESGFDPYFPDDDIYCFEVDEEYIFAGTGSGLVVIEKENMQVKNRISIRDGLPDNQILSLKRFGDSLFVGTVRGLVVMSNSLDSAKNVRADQFNNQDIYDLETTDSSLWIASSTGAYQLIFSSDKLQRFQDPHSIIFNRCFNIEKFENELWLSSDGGFVKLNLETGKTNGFNSITSGLTNSALAVNETIAAVASDNGMMLIYHKDSKFPTEHEFTTNDGLPSNYIYALEIDGDFLWIGTDRGLTRFMWNNPYRVD